MYEKVCAKLSRSLTSSVSSPSLKKAPLASEDDLEDDLKNSPRVQLRKTSNSGQRRCHSEVCIHMKIHIKVCLKKCPGTYVYL